MSRLGVAILGTGAIAGVHIDAYKQFADRCEIRVLCDMFKDKAQKIKESKNLDQANVLEDWHEILTRDDIDIISLCLPAGEHGKVSVPLLEAGKHVLVEKPMAPSLAECDAMIEASKKSGAILGAVSQNRYKIPVMKVKKLIEAKVTGRVLLATVNSLWWRGANYYDLMWRGRWSTESGGVVMSHAVHHLDMLQWMIGMPEKVTAVIANNAHGNSECEDIAVAILQYPGMTAQLTTTLVSHDEEQEMTFQTEKARLSIPWKPAASKALGNGFPTADSDVLKELQAKYDALPELELEGHPAQIKNFLDAVEGKDALLIDGAEGRKTIELIMAIYKSAYTGEAAVLPLSPADDFYSKERVAQLMPHFNEKTINKDMVEGNTAITLGRNVGK